jgi:hypothetical protein
MVRSARVAWPSIARGRRVGGRLGGGSTIFASSLAAGKVLA